MSYTEIVKFTKSGRASMVDEVQNSHRSAMVVWNRLEELYLPPFKPYWSKPNETYHRHDLEDMKDIWNLADNPDVTKKHRIVLISTFDRTIVHKENIPELLDAFRSFEWESSLKEQADIIESLYKKDKNFLAIAWNQTSIGENYWLYPEGFDNRKYNILTDDSHYELFDSFK